MWKALPILLLAMAAGSSVHAAPPAIGKPAPALVVPELDGTKFDLAALRGKVVVVNYWCTWCEPCRQEMPAINAYYARNRERGLVVLGLSADREHDRKDVVKVASTVGYPAAMMSDAEQDGFGHPSVMPITYVIDTAGILREQVIGRAVTEDALGELVSPLLPKP